MFNEEFARHDGKVIRSLSLGGREFESSISDIADGRISADKAWWQSFLRGSLTEITGPSNGTLRIVDIFSGCGGLTLGVIEAARAFGFDVVPIAAVDVDATALAVYQHNIKPQITLNVDASSLVDYMVLGNGDAANFPYTPEIICDRLRAEVGKVDILVAGPPCQGHSNLNNRTRRDDPRNILYVTTVAIAVALGVKAVLIENVPEVVNDKNSVVFTAMTLLRNAGYTFIDSGVLATHSLGGAQTRKRYFLTAVRSDQRQPLVNLELVKGALGRKPGAVRWAIGDLEKVKPIGIMNTVPVLSAENVARVNYLFDNDVDNLPNHIRPDCHKDGTTYNSVYGRMWWNRPAPTLTTGFLTPGRGRFVHPRQRRVLTPHEAARIQFFPDSYSFVGAMISEPSRTLLTKWIGDAVPPLLGYAAAMPMMTSLALQLVTPGKGCTECVDVSKLAKIA